MPVNGFLVDDAVQKYNYESLENYNTPDFSTSSTYQVGDYVMYQGKLYKCTTAITTGGAWDSTKWSLAILSDDVADLKSAIDEIDGILPTKAGIIRDTVSGSPATFYPDATVPNLLGLTVEIEPVQSGSGTPSPDNVRPFTAVAAVATYYGGENNTSLQRNYVVDEQGEVNRISTSDYYCSDLIYLGDSPTWFIAFNQRASGYRVYRRCYYDANGEFLTTASNTPSANSSYTRMYSRVGSGESYDEIPIDARYVRFSFGKGASGELFCAMPFVSRAYADMPSGVFAAKLNWLTGKLSVYPRFASYNGETLVGPWLSSMDGYAEGTTPTIGAEVIDLGGVPTVYDIDHVTMSIVPNSENTAYSRQGPITVEYAADIKAYIDSKISAAVAALS